MNALATSLQTYFTAFAHTQRDLSAYTITSYRDTWRMLLKYLTSTHGVPADALDFDAVTATNVTGFLDHLEHERGNSSKTRNTRLTAIRAVLGQALPDHPEHAATITQVLAIPPKRTTRPVVEFLTPDEVNALLAAPDSTNWTGRRDHALLAMTVQTGLRISEVCSLTQTTFTSAPAPTSPAPAKDAPTHHPADPGHHQHDDDLPRRTDHPPWHCAVLRPRTTLVPRRARTPPRQTRRRRRGHLSQPPHKAHHHAHPATHRSNEPPRSRRGRLRHRTMARARRHPQHRRLPSRRHDHQASRHRPDQATDVQPGTYQPEPDILAWLTSL